MIPNTDATTTTKPAPMTRDEVKKMLRDAAFVLQMARRVKAEILSEQAESTKPTTRPVTELATGLVV
jgi:hypothetical protein